MFKYIFGILVLSNLISCTPNDVRDDFIGDFNFIYSTTGGIEGEPISYTDTTYNFTGSILKVNSDKLEMIGLFPASFYYNVVDANQLSIFVSDAQYNNNEWQGSIYMDSINIHRSSLYMGHFTYSKITGIKIP